MELQKKVKMGGYPYPGGGDINIYISIDSTTIDISIQSLPIKNMSDHNIQVPDLQFYTANPRSSYPVLHVGIE